MNQTEQKRKELLESTRALYYDHYTPPAIHPRFRNASAKLEEKEEPQGTFGLRFMICCILFLCFAYIEYHHIEIRAVTSERIINAVTDESDFIDVWRKL